MELSQKYLDLIDRVNKINADAAAYMMNEAPALTSFKNVGDLSYTFNWASTRFGHEFWDDIKHQIQKVSKKRNQIFTKDYLDLIEDVRSINVDAAYFLKYEAIKRRDFRPSFFLGDVFNWHDTIQPPKYWSKLNDQITLARRIIKSRKGKR